MDIAFYIKAAGYANSAFMASCTAMYSFFITVPQYWLKIWTESTQHSDLPYILGYVMLILAAWLTTNAMMWGVAPDLRKLDLIFAKSAQTGQQSFASRLDLAMSFIQGCCLPLLGTLKDEINLSGM